MTEELVRVTKVQAPTQADRLFSFGKQLTTEVTFAISVPGAIFEVAVHVDSRLDDGDIVTAARHKLHAPLTQAAEGTSAWALPPDWFSERLPAPADPVEDEPIPL